MNKYRLDAKKSKFFNRDINILWFNTELTLNNRISSKLINNLKFYKRNSLNFEKDMKQNNKIIDNNSKIKKDLKFSEYFNLNNFIEKGKSTNNIKNFKINFKSVNNKSTFDKQHYNILKKIKNIDYIKIEYSNKNIKETNNILYKNKNNLYLNLKYFDNKEYKTNIMNKIKNINVIQGYNFSNLNFNMVLLGKN